MGFDTSKIIKNNVFGVMFNFKMTCMCIFHKNQNRFKAHYNGIRRTQIQNLMFRVFQTLFPKVYTFVEKRFIGKIC